MSQRVRVVRRQAGEQALHGARNDSIGDKLDAPPADANEDRQFVTALARGLDILAAFRAGDGALGNQELATRTGLPKPTVSRLTYTLTKVGYLAARSGGYELGVRTLALGQVSLSNLQIRHLAAPLMDNLASVGNVHVGLGVRDGSTMLYVDACEGEAIVGLRLHPGARIPIATTAMGRAYLFAMPPHARAELMARLEERYGGAWPKISAGIQRAEDEIRSRGFCTVLGEWQQDINGAAAPIAIGSGQEPYVLNFGGPAYRLSAKKIQSELGPMLARMARQLAEAVA